MKTLLAAALLAFLFASSTAFAWQLPFPTEPQPVKVDHGDDVK